MASPFINFNGAGTCPILCLCQWKKIFLASIRNILIKFSFKQIMVAPPSPFMASSISRCYSFFSIAKDHAVVTCKESKVYLKPRHGLVLHNGQEIDKEIKLHHQDRYE